MNFRRKTNDNREQIVKRQIADWLTLRGAWVVYYSAMNQGRQADGSVRAYRSRYLRPGIPDIIACWKGRLVGIEVKRPKDPQRIMLKGAKPKPAGRLSEVQRLELEAIRRAAGIPIVAYGLDDVIRVLAPEQLRPSARQTHDVDRGGANDAGDTGESGDEEEEP